MHQAPEGCPAAEKDAEIAAAHTEHKSPCPAQLSVYTPSSPLPRRSAAPRAFSPTSFITQRDASCRCPSTCGSQVGSHGRPTSGHLEPIRAFDSSALPGIQTHLDTSADIRNLVRIEGSGVQIPSAPPRNSRSEAHLRLSSYPRYGSCRHIGRNLGDRVLPERDGIVLSRWHSWPCRPLTTSLFPSVSVAYRTAPLRSQRMATND
jgi:hypothetical protein